MKVKSFHCSKSGLVQPISSAIGTHFQCVSDKLPPAYPCEGERIVFIGIEMDKKIPIEVEQLCKTLSPARTQSVAFYLIKHSDTDINLQPMIDMLKTNGVKTVGETFKIIVKKSLFKKATINDTDIKAALAWAIATSEI
ncbi:MAG: hypothetical protein R3Y35_14845 [Clostridia bacterium]